jgi:hypothetical protein
MSVTYYVDSYGEVHAGGAIGNDTTLCGDALEGENGETPLSQTRATLSCLRCINIVAYCRDITRDALGIL